MELITKIKNKEVDMFKEIEVKLSIGEVYMLFAVLGKNYSSKEEEIIEEVYEGKNGIPKNSRMIVDELRRITKLAESRRL